MLYSKKSYCAWKFKVHVSKVCFELLENQTLSYKELILSQPAIAQVVEPVIQYKQRSVFLFHMCCSFYKLIHIRGVRSEILWCEKTKTELA